MRRILVTGANKGIGLAIVTRLLRDFDDTFLFLGSRDLGRGQAAVEQIKTEVGAGVVGRVEVLRLDVTSDASVSEAVDAVAKHGTEPLYGLVNNAGGVPGTARETLDLNTIGLRRVCEAFLPLIQKEGGECTYPLNRFPLQES